MYVFGEDIVANFHGMVEYVKSSQWLGIYTKGECSCEADGGCTCPPGRMLMWLYVHGSQSPSSVAELSGGNVTFGAGEPSEAYQQAWPLPVGSYVMGFFSGEGYDLAQMDLVPFTVVDETKPGLMLSSRIAFGSLSDCDGEFSTDQRLIASFINPTPTSHDWLGIFMQDACRRGPFGHWVCPSGSIKMWLYSHGSQSASSEVVGLGSVEFALGGGHETNLRPLAAGAYVMVYFANGGYSAMVNPVPFTVSAQLQPQSQLRPLLSRSRREHNETDTMTVLP